MKNKPIKQFISKVLNKDYKEAHQLLQQSIEEKIKNRVRVAIAQKN